MAKWRQAIFHLWVRRCEKRANVREFRATASIFYSHEVLISPSTGNFIFQGWLGEESLHWKFWWNLIFNGQFVVRLPGIVGAASAFFSAHPLTPVWSWCAVVVADLRSFIGHRMQGLRIGLGRATSTATTSADIRCHLHSDGAHIHTHTHIEAAQVIYLKTPRGHLHSFGLCASSLHLLSFFPPHFYLPLLIP